MLTHPVVVVLFVFTIASFALAQCTKTTYITTAGTACGGTTGNICVTELSCNTTSNTCQFPPIPGAYCSSDAGCANNRYDMLCLNNKCTLSFKNAGEACTLNAECASTKCNSGVCVALQVGSSCNTTSSCGTTDYSLFCTTTSICAATVAEGGLCGVLSGGYFVQCKPGLICTGNGANGTCMAPVGEGATCYGPASFYTTVYPAPFCSNKDKQLTCTNQGTFGKCVAPYSIAEGMPCGTTAILQAGGSCDSTTSACINNVCTAYRKISCKTNNVCQSGYCDCPNTSTDGTCSVYPYSSTCSRETANLLACTGFYNSQRFNSYCSNIVKEYRCCLRRTSIPNSDLTSEYCSSITPTKSSVATSITSSIFVALVAALTHFA